MHLSPFKFDAIVSTFIGSTPREASDNTFLNNIVFSRSCRADEAPSSSDSGSVFSPDDLKERSRDSAGAASTYTQMANSKFDRAQSLSLAADEKYKDARNARTPAEASEHTAAANHLDSKSINCAKKGIEYLKAAGNRQSASEQFDRFATISASDSASSSSKRRDDGPNASGDGNFHGRNDWP
ncbi:hypothetical protein ACVBEF_00760 [Glaciimonas sp. GG7]